MHPLSTIGVTTQEGIMTCYKGSGDFRKYHSPLASQMALSVARILAWLISGQIFAFLAWASFHILVPFYRSSESATHCHILTGTQLPREAEKKINTEEETEMELKVQRENNPQKCLFPFSWRPQEQRGAHPPTRSASQPLWKDFSWRLLTAFSVLWGFRENALCTLQLF